MGKTNFKLVKLKPYLLILIKKNILQYNSILYRKFCTWNSNFEMIIFTI